MGNWIEITLDDLRDYKVSALVDALQNQALGNEQMDPSAQVIADVIAHVRRKIASHPLNHLDQSLYAIPKSLKPLACRRIIATMKGRLEIPLTELETKELERDDSDLNRIAEGKDSVELPDVPDARKELIAPQSTGAELASGGKRSCVRVRLNGL